MQPESRASKVKRFSEAALFHLEDVSDPGTKALTFALVALTEAVMKAGTDTHNLGTDLTELGKTISSLDAEVEKLRLNGER